LPEDSGAVDACEAHINDFLVEKPKIPLGLKNINKQTLV
jgi:hypothetical protein